MLSVSSSSTAGSQQSVREFDTGKDRVEKLKKGKWKFIREGNSMAERDSREIGPEEFRSKSAIVRAYIEKHPTATPTEIVEALSVFGVTVSDVSNARNRAAPKVPRTQRIRKARIDMGRPKGSKNKPKVGALVPVAPRQATNVTVHSPIVAKNVGLTLRTEDIDATVKFIHKVGGMQAAEHLMIIVRQIKDVQ